MYSNTTLDSGTVNYVLSHPATWILALVLIMIICIAINDFIKGFINKKEDEYWENEGFNATCDDEMRVHNNLEDK